MMEALAREATSRYVQKLWDDKSRLMKAAVDDGWPEPMVRSGLSMHRVSWDVEAMAEALEVELRAVSQIGDYRLVWPQRVHHIWPALPAAGLSPVLVGMLVGVEQVVHPSSRGVHLARSLAAPAPFELASDKDSWRRAPLVVVSGSDETVARVRRVVEPAGAVVGYGHRVSFAVVVDGRDATLDFERVASEIARDVVMWHQKGCFSVRAVLFCGRSQRRRQFCECLAAAIDRVERRWGACDVGDLELARRAQAMGMAEMYDPVWCDGLGYVRDTGDETFDGSREAIHSVTVHSVAGSESVAGAVTLAPGHIQGVSLSTGDGIEPGPWLTALSRRGATRICEAGALQTPPASWWHDGRPNALSWARVVTLK